jgi:hypothetical protein
VPASLFEQLLGERYAALAPAVQRFHRQLGPTSLSGRVKTAAPATAVARLLAGWLGTPRGEADAPLRFERHATPEGETWTRHFETRTMVSRLSLRGALLDERVGPVGLTFQVSASEGRLRMALVGLRALGLPWPRRLLPRVTAEESGSGDALHFEVHAWWPVIGTVAHYRGHLQLGPRDAAP